MPQEIGEAVHADVEGEEQLLEHGQGDGTQQQAQKHRVEALAVPVENPAAQDHQHADGVFAVDLEGRQAGALHEAVREPAQEDEQQERGGRQGEAAQKRGGAGRPGQEGRGQQEGEAFEVAPGDPELGRKVGLVLVEDAHALVGHGMQQIHEAHAEQGHPQDQEVAALETLARVPGHDKSGPGHGDAEQLRKGMEKEIVVSADDEQSHEPCERHGPGENEFF
jgi:hypothetical protein